jgi:hypothetical protein
MKTRFFVALAFAFTLALSLAAACGDDASPDARPGNQFDAPGAPADAAPADAAIDAAP